MNFCVVVLDEWLLHIREIYLCEWDRELQSMRQTLIATGVFSTLFFARRWVGRTIYKHLKINGKVNFSIIKKRDIL